MNEGAGVLGRVSGSVRKHRLEFAGGHVARRDLSKRAVPENGPVRREEGAIRARDATDSRSDV